MEHIPKSFGCVTGSSIPDLAHLLYKAFGLPAKLYQILHQPSLQGQGTFSHSPTRQLGWPFGSSACTGEQCHVDLSPFGALAPVFLLLCLPTSWFEDYSDKVVHGLSPHDVGHSYGLCPCLEGLFTSSF